MKLHRTKNYPGLRRSLLDPQKTTDGSRSANDWCAGAGQVCGTPGPVLRVLEAPETDARPQSAISGVGHQVMG